MELKDNEVLVLRTTDREGKAYGGFKWPQSGMVEAPDWDGKPDCGGGLHGLPKGVGNGGLLDADGVAQIVKVNIDDGFVDLNGKCKFRRGEVMFWGDLREAANIVKAQYPCEPVVFCTLTGGDGSTNTGGDGSINTGGYGSTNTGGYGSTNTGGDGSTNTGGYGSTLIFKWWDGNRYRFTIGYVGEDGIEPNVAYKLDADHKIVRA